MQSKLDVAISLKNLFFPRNNHWLKRVVLVFAFVFFDYFSTIVFCRTPSEEANVYARLFMENLGIISGLTLFVLAFNLPIYMTLSLDSHIVKLPVKATVPVEILIDSVFAWFIAGLHFSGGSSWFWLAPSLIRQSVGAILYLVMAVMLIRHHRLGRVG